VTTTTDPGRGSPDRGARTPTDRRVVTRTPPPVPRNSEIAPGLRLAAVKALTAALEGRTPDLGPLRAHLEDLDPDTPAARSFETLVDALEVGDLSLARAAFIHAAAATHRSPQP
jgi:hypothetical protein